MLIRTCSTSTFQQTTVPYNMVLSAAFPPKEATIAAFLSTLLISLVPNFILILSPNYGQMPANAAGRQNALLSIGQALAAGGLLGDVFLHTLPHAMTDEHRHSQGHNHSTSSSVPIGLMVIVGFTVFFIFDIVVRSFGGDHHHHAGHSHDSGSNAVQTKCATTSVFNNSTVLLNLAADSLHNFTDGLAIGASFAAASSTEEHSILSLLKSRGGVASLSVMMHELPHELGDFSILVSNGMSKRQAIMAQFSTAVAAFLGTFMGLAASAIDDTLGHEVLLPFTAGGFVYLAAANIIPELLEENNAGFLLRSAQVLFFVIGVLFMQMVAILEEVDGSHSHNHHEHMHQVVHKEYHDHDHGEL